MTDVLWFDRAEEMPGGWWPASADRDPRTTRAWASTSRWDGDGSGFAALSSEPVVFAAVRRVRDHQGWARMNAVDVCAGLARGVEQPAAEVSAARSESMEQVNLALAGYTTPIWNVDLDPARTIELLTRSGATAVLHMEAQSPLVPLLETMGWVVGVTELYPVLTDIGRSLDEFLERLTRKQRQNILRDFRHLRERGGTIELLIGDEAAAAMPEVARLEASADEAHGISADSERLLAMNQRLHAAFGANMAVALVRRFDGVAVASCTLFKGQDRILPRLAGFDSVSSRPLAGYFHTCYYEPLTWAWHTGATEVLLGPGSLKPKLFRGAVLRYLVSAVPPQLPALAGLLRRTDAALRMSTHDLVDDKGNRLP